MAKLNYNIHGEGQPLIVLHGLFGSSRNWNTVAKELARDRQVIAVDLRNHGDSEHTETMTWINMVEDIDTLMTELGIASAALLGHSMGGKAAMAFALSLPQKTDALIVADIAPVAYEPVHIELIDAMLSLPLDEIHNRAEAEQHLLDAGVADSMVRQFLLSNLTRSNGSYVWRLNLPVLRESMPDMAGFPEDWPAAPYEGPARFLAGGESDYILPKHYQVISRLFPRATVHTIEGVGHWLHAEKPEAFVSEVRDFLNQT
ncbi:MAG: alpha/beta fold hydrolase [Gammaproteobacteria bacterium]